MEPSRFHSFRVVVGLLILFTMDWDIKGLAQSPYPRSTGARHGTTYTNDKQTYQDMSTPNYEEGSLWGEASRFNVPFDEIPAPEFNLGDIIVVQVKENFRSQENIRYENTTESEVQFDVAGVWKNSTDKSLFGKLGNAIDYPQTNIQGTDDYKGETRGNRTSQLTLEIPCTVTKILPDGRLMIEGRQARIVGRDKKNRILSGTIRPEDVDPVTRTISSTRIADSQLRWEGKGPGENVTNPGFIHRILDYIPLF